VFCKQAFNSAPVPPQAERISDKKLNKKTIRKR